MNERIMKEVNEATDYAENAPYADPEDALKHVYAEKEGERIMAIMSYIDAITLAMKEEMERDERVFVLGEDVGRKGGVFKATNGFMNNLGNTVCWIHLLRNLRLQVLELVQQCTGCVQLLKCNLLTSSCRQ